jgi:cytochrome c-type biogenesis protein CcmH/NrfG
MSLLLLCSSCATAQISRAAAVQDVGPSGEIEALGPDAILRRGEAYYHFMRSYAALRGSAEDKQIDEAIAALREAIQAQPESVFLQTELARLLMRRGDVPAALQACHKALRMDPKYQPAYMVLGQLHAHLQHKEEARAAFRKAIELEPHDEEGYIYLGILYLAASQQAEAIAVLQELLQAADVVAWSL